MSVIIKGLSMPKNCLICPCCVGEGIGMGRQHYCQAIDDEPHVSENHHPKNCPLIEIPTSHGRLIDADALIHEFKNYSKILCQIGIDAKSVIQVIDQAPTIIKVEASE